jgi:phosphonate transport system substrate-binding protein
MFNPARRPARTLAIVLCLTISGAQTPSVAAPDKASDKSIIYVMGVFPHLPPRELEKVFAPMAADLGNVIGRDIQFRSSTTYKKFTKNITAGKYDIAFMQPFDYIKVAGKDGYLPAATRSQRLAAIIVTKTDSPLDGVKSLRNKRISLPPESAAVSILVKNDLIRNGLIPGKDVTLSYHRSHLSCMQKVLIGETDACGTAAPAVRFFEKRMKVELKTIAKTRDIPHTLFAIHSRVPEEERKKITQRIINWANTDEGQELLKRGSLKPFVEIQDSDYDIVREIANSQ